MPELPEVETIRCQLDPVVTGRRVVGAGAHWSPKFASAPEALGTTIVGVSRRGKYLLIGLDDGRELVIHLGMTGRLQIVPRRAVPTETYVRAWWDLDGDETLEYHDVRRFGRIAVVPRGEYQGLPTLAKLGPEPFSDEFTPEQLWSSLRTSSARVKTQLLSQRPVAGVGNIYADEALWRAGVHPARRRITRSQAAALHPAIIDVLRSAVQRGGTTFRDYRGLDGSSGTNQDHLDCYGRADEPCARCGELLIRTVIDGRGTTLCVTCQPG